MGFGKSINLARFRMREDIPASVDILSKLRQFCFQSIDDMPTEMSSIGWTNYEDMLDTNFVTSSPEYGAYHMFSLRIDTRKIPSPILKKRLAEAISEEKKKGAKFIARERKKEIKELVILKLASKIPPTPAVYDVLVSLPAKEIWLACSSNKIVDVFLEQFEKTFGMQLDRLTPCSIAEELFPSVEKGLANLEVTRYGASSYTEPFLGLSTDVILGQDFLTWLWYMAESGATFTSDANELFSVSESRKLTLTTNDETITMSAKVGDGNFEEIRGSVTNTGKVVTGMGLTLYSNEASWSMNLTADSLCPSSFKTPKIDKDKEDDDPTGMILEQIYLYEQGLRGFLAMYKAFLAVRLDAAAWRKAVEKIQEWAK